MKKILLLLLALIVILSVCACQTKSDDPTSEPEYTFAVATDIHIFANSLYTKDNISYYETLDKMIHLSVPIFQTMADEIINKKYDFLLLSGDLTENGDETSHLAVADMLKKLENAGVDVYVINGNHDVMNTAEKKNTAVSQNRFAEIYSEFGYAEADAKMDGTLCYSVPIKNKFRLIAIDNMVYHTDKDQNMMTEEMPDQKIDWIDAQVEKAAQENLIPILMSHKALLNHWPKAEIILEDVDIVQANETVCKNAVVSGAQIGFVGHHHFNDIKKMTYNGLDYYEVLTGCACYLESDYRSVSFINNTFSIKTSTLNKINTSYASPFISEEIISQVNENYPLYAKKCFNSKVKNTVKSYINKIINKFNFGSEKLNDFFKYNLVYTVLEMPIYRSDENKTISLEEIVSPYGVTLPSTSYKTVFDIIPTVVEALIKGNENLCSSDEIILGKYALYSLLYYIDSNAETIRSSHGQDMLIKLDMEKLFKEGILECYDSYLMPSLTLILKESDSRKIAMAASLFDNNFNAISTFSESLEELTSGIVNDIDKYFSSKEIHIEQLIEEGVFDNYLSDLLIDELPNDREIIITLKGTNEEE